MSTADLVVVILYFAGVTACGLYFAKRNKSTEEYFLGTSLYVFFQPHHFGTADTAAMLSGAQKAEQILPYFIMNYLPAGVAGRVLAAAMSSLDSSLNAISTVSVVDIYRRHLVKERDDAHYLVVARIVAIAASVFMILGAIVGAATEAA